MYAEYIVQNVGLDEAQAGIKIARRNINNLRLEYNMPEHSSSIIIKKIICIVIRESFCWVKSFFFFFFYF